MEWRQIDLLSRFDRDQIASWNSTELSLVNASIHELFEHHVQLKPSAQAVFAWDGCLTYQELNTMSENIAENLAGLGVTTGLLVPICFEKSWVTTVAIIAILKAGEAVVPLDQAYPSSRLLDIVGNTKASVVLCDPKFAHVFAGKVRSVVTNVKDAVRSLSKAQARPAISVRGSDPALVLFTSGSTGKPKGVVHSHSSMCSSGSAYGAALNLTDSSRVFQFSAYSFDISMIDNVATLIQGGCICTPSKHQRLNDVAQFIRQSDANWAFLTPSLARQIEPGQVRGLKTLILGGEYVPQDIVRDWTSPTRCILAGYGPCESGICASEILSPARRPGIGRGIACHTWVVNLVNDTTLVPIGCIGELLIKGPINFSGYLNDKAGSLAAFLNDPPWLPKNCKQLRLYRTVTVLMGVLYMWVARTIKSK